MKKEINRRDFLKSAAVSAAGVAALSACAPRVEVGVPVESTTAPAVEQSTGPITAACDELSTLLTTSSAEMGEITTATDGGQYDIIVIGAGASGVPCAVKAFQGGAKVLLLQKEAAVVSQGGSCNGIVSEASDQSAILNFMHLTNQVCAFRNDRDQLKVYASNSGEAAHWYFDEATASGFAGITSKESVIDYGEEFGKMTTFTASVTKPDNTGTAMASIIAAYQDKMDVRFSTPAVQLIKDGNKVTGVYAKDADGKYIKFSASKGVVIATGDYQNNDAMVAKYCPDVINFEKKQFHKTGDGQLLGMMIGAQMEPIGHTKMIHDFDTGPMYNEPFLRVDMNGNRFHNETTELSVVNNFMRNYGPEQAGKYCQIFDSNYVEQVTEWGGRPTPEEKIALYMPEVEMEDRTGVLKNIIATFKADTLEELAKKLELPVENLVKAVARYNELVDQGFDADYGKTSKYLKKIEKAPFFGVHKNVRVSALCSGILINGDFAVLNEENQPFENLYAIGNVSGQFYGSADYPLHFPGLSLGRCVTAGYTLGKALAAK